MTDDLELVKGSGNAFRDLGHKNPDVQQLKAILAANIIGVLDDRALSVRKAETITGVKASEFSRIRNAHLGRFTIDRLMNILASFDQRVTVQVTVKPFMRFAGRLRSGGRTRRLSLKRA